MEYNKLIVLFPGGNYNVDMPLLYYAKFSYETRGFKSINISYGNKNETNTSYDNYLIAAKKVVLEQIAHINFSQYDEIVFVSKSIGSVIAGWLAIELCLSVKHVFLTPINDTLPYITGDNIIAVIAGKLDKQLDAEVLETHCIREGIQLKQFDNVGHRLEHPHDINYNLELLKQMVALYL